MPPSSRYRKRERNTHYAGNKSRRGYREDAEHFRRMPATNDATEARSHSMRQDWTTCQSRMVWGLAKTPASRAAAAQARPRKKATKGARDRPNIPCKLLISKRLIHPLEKAPAVSEMPRSSPQAWQNAAPGTNSTPHSGQAEAKPAGEGWKRAALSAGECQNSCVALRIASGIGINFGGLPTYWHAMRQTCVFVSLLFTDTYSVPGEGAGW